MRSEESPSRHRDLDLATTLAISLLAYAIANLVHEGLGHGGVCVAVGGHPLELNAIYFECDKSALDSGAIRWISAGGTLATLVLAALSALARRMLPGKPSHLHYFLWLLMTVCLLQGTGYWLFSGLGNLGDWTEVTRGWQPAAAWRGGLVVLGLAGYILSIRVGLRSLYTLLGQGASLERDGRLLTLPAYLAGGAMYVVAGLFNPASPQLVLVSAAAASFGGTSALAWMASMFGNTRSFPEPDGPSLELPRSPGWLAAGGLAFFVFVGLFGRTVHLR